MQCPSSTERASAVSWQEAGKSGDMRPGGHSAGRTALVTGANRGLGREIARQLAEVGFHVVISARDPAKARTTADSFGSSGASVDWIELDVDNARSVGSAVRTVLDRHGSIDVLVNNAGVLLDGPDAQTASVLALPPERLLQSFVTNTMGALHMMQAVLPSMRDRAYGRIVNVSSRAGQLDELRPGVPSYRISKTALNSLTRVAAAEFSGENIKINAMCPGWLRTDMGGANAPLSVAEGADTAIWLATLPPDGPTGGFFRSRKVLPW